MPNELLLLVSYNCMQSSRLGMLSMSSSSSIELILLSELLAVEAFETESVSMSWDLLLVKRGAMLVLSEKFWAGSDIVSIAKVLFSVFISFND